MVSFRGTIGNDTLRGTDRDDVFRPLTGIDLVDGGAGYDALYVDYSRFVRATARFPSVVTLSDTGFAGTVESRVGNDVVEFSQIEKLDVKLGDRGDYFIVNIDAPIGERAMSLDAGGGIDRILLNLTSMNNVTLCVEPTGNLVTSFGWLFAGFEEYDITVGGGVNTIVTGSQHDNVRLGAGTNTVALGDGNDFVSSSGGMDTIDAGEGDDIWVLDLSASDTKRTLSVDGFQAIAAVKGLASATGIEHIDANLGSGGDAVILTDAIYTSVSGGGGDDSFTVVRGSNVQVDGGIGLDTASIDLHGMFASPYSDLRASGIGGFSGNLSNVKITDVEMLTAMLSDYDDLVEIDGTALMQGGQIRLTGGAGQDYLTLDFGAANTAIKTAIDTGGTLRVGTNTFAGFEVFRLTGGVQGDQLYGGELGNTIDGGDGSDTIVGGAGVDTLIGGSGNDRLYGRGGFDELSGGPGDDKYYVTSSSLIKEQDGEGNDTLYSSVSDLLSGYTENLILTGTADNTGFGNFLDNVIIGNVGENVLFGDAGRDAIDGGAGRDRIFGESGADTLTGGAGGDTFEFSTLETSAQHDTIRDFVHGTDLLVFDQDVFTGAAQNTGPLNLAQFALGSEATGTTQHFIYNRANGALYYDPDGVGGQAQTWIATLIGKPVVSASDLFIA